MPGHPRERAAHRLGRSARHRDRSGALVHARHPPALGTDDGCWLRVGRPAAAWVGERGISADRREGDRTTPAGMFGFGRVMYGVAPDPGVRYRYRRVVCGDWWVEDPRSPSYNRFRHVPCGSRPPLG